MTLLMKAAFLLLQEKYAEAKNLALRISYCRTNILFKRTLPSLLL